MHAPRARVALLGLLVLVLAGAAVGAWSADQRVDAAEDAREDAERARRTAEADAAEARDARRALQEHVNATAGDVTLRVGGAVASLPGLAPSDANWSQHLRDLARELAFARDFLDAPGNATHPDVLEALNESARTLQHAQRAFAAGFAGNGTRDGLVDLGRGLTAFGEALEASSARAPREALHVRLEASAFARDVRDAVGASVDLAHVEWTNATSPPTLLVNVHGFVPSARPWFAIWALEVCPQDAASPRECAATADAHRFGGYVALPSERVNASTLRLALDPHVPDTVTWQGEDPDAHARDVGERLRNATALRVRAVSWPLEHGEVTLLTDACLVTAEARACEDPEGDVAASEDWPF